MLKWLLAIVVPVALAIGAIAWYVTSGKGTLPWQEAAVKGASKPDDKTPTLAPNQRPQPKSAGPGWALNCRSGAQETGLRCRLSQRVVQQGSGQLLTQVTFLLPADKQTAGQFSVRLPLGVSLQTATSIQVDENAPQNLRIRTCDRGGCYVEGALSPQFLAQLRKGNTLTIAFQNLAQNTISLPLSLDGFEEAYTKAQNV